MLHEVICRGQRVCRKEEDMIKDYEDFKKFILQQTTIDLNAYKERQMKRRIDTLIARNKFKDYDSYCNAIKVDKDLMEEFVNYITINVSEFYRNPALWKTLEDVILPILLISLDLILKYGVQHVRQVMSHIHWQWYLQRRFLYQRYIYMLQI